MTTAIGFGPLMLVGAFVVQNAGVLRRGAIVASIPIALLVALILYVNEVPDRRADDRAGKRTLPVRLPRYAVIKGCTVAGAAASFASSSSASWPVLPIPDAPGVLAPAPIVQRVHNGLVQYYDQPYGLMSVMAVNIRVHLYVGVLLFVGYLIVIAVSWLAPGRPALPSHSWRRRPTPGQLIVDKST